MAEATEREIEMAARIAGLECAVARLCRDAPKSARGEDLAIVPVKISAPGWTDEERTKIGERAARHFLALLQGSRLP